MTPEEIVADDVARNGPYASSRPVTNQDRARALTKAIRRGPRLHITHGQAEHIKANIRARATRPTTSSSHTGSWLMLVGILLGGLLAIAVLAPQVRTAHHHEDRARAELRELVDDFNAHCRVNVADGSAQCEPGTFSEKNVVAK